MTTINTLLGSDTITSSRTVINTNFSNLNTDKEEISNKSTDTALTANSDTLYPTQKAVKAYVDGVGVANATATVRGVVEVATQAEVDAGTATGATGASLVVTPATLAGSAAPQVVTFTSSGTWTKDAGLKYIVVECQGSGGRGSSSAGGGSGGYNKKLILAAALGATETVTVGTANLGSGNTSLGSLLVAGNGGNASDDTVGAAGAATGGDVNIPGQIGGEAANNAGGGRGGSSFMGNGGGFTAAFDSTATRSGESGTGFGAGGSGNADATDGSPAASGNGGAGTVGIIIVTEYYS